MAREMKDPVYTEKSEDYQYDALFFKTQAVEVEAKRPMFSEPSQGSDLVLVVEGQKLYVHRLILTMVSPVFEAMFYREFKEKVAAEVQLPGKKADEMRDLLRQIYPNDRGEITMGNVEHLLKLADEYQIKVVLHCCKKFLIDKPYATKDIIIKALLLAQRYSMDEVRKHCYKLLGRMNLDELEKLEGFENLDRESTREVLGNRLRNLENFLKKLYPQFAGIVDFARFLWEESGRPMKQCPIHYPFNIFNEMSSDFSFQTRLECSFCKKMLASMATNYDLGVRGVRGMQRSYPNYGSDMKFDKDFIVVLQNMFSLLKLH